MSHLKYMSFPGEQLLGFPSLCLSGSPSVMVLTKCSQQQTEAYQGQTSLISHALVSLLSYISSAYTVDFRNCGRQWQLIEPNKVGLNLDWDI